ncbi:ABC transporter substrate-binding protein [Myxococcota bacterium]|nr:ABC transporter substrate-binding protein [Myxococcota bacterium]
MLGRGEASVARFGALAVAALTACVRPAAPAPDGVMTVSVEQTASFVRNFNPLIAGGARWPTAAGIYEPLLVFNTVAGEWVPWLATGYQWLDGDLRLRFSIRPGVTWSDGTPFTAADVAFTFDLLKRQPALDQSAAWRYLVEVVAPDASTVDFVLKRPYSPALGMVAHQPLVPAHVWSKVENPVTWSNPEPVGTGPFTEVVVFKNQVYELGRNPRYWQPGKPAIKGLRFPALPSNDQANLALVNGEVDWAGNFVPAIDRVFVGRDPEHHKYWFPLVGSTVFLYPNATVKPLDDLRVRRALSQAIDRQRLVRVAMYEYTRPSDATGLSDAYASWRDPEAAAKSDATRYDADAAAKLLDAAGLVRSGDDEGFRRLPSGERWRLEIEVVAGWSDWVRAAQVISRDLRAIGIDAPVKVYDQSAWFERLQKGKFSLAVAWSVEGPTPHGFYRWLMARDTVRPVGDLALGNWHRYGSAKAEELLTALEGTTDLERQRVIAKELQRAFVDELPAIPLFPNPSWGAYNTTRFEGFPSAADPFTQLSPNKMPDCLLVMTSVRPRSR